MESKAVPEQKCTVCSEPHAARFHCAECGENMCDKARAMHDAFTRNRSHQVGAIGASSPLAFCPEHAKKVDLFDKKCGRLVCAECVVAAHFGHPLQRIPEAANECRPMIES